MTIGSGVTVSADYPVEVGFAATASVGTLTNYGTIDGSTGTWPGAIAILGGSGATAVVNAAGATVLGGRMAVDLEFYLTGATLGSITNDGTMSASRYVILNEQGTIGSIHNGSTGQIIGTSDRANGIENNGTITGAIVNDGLIDMSSTTVNDYPGTPEANPVGIYNLGTVSSIVNNGRIVATGTTNSMGIENSNGTTGSIGTLVNTGTIVTDAYSNVRGTNQAYTVGIVSWGGTIGSLVNSGTISATGHQTAGCVTCANPSGADTFGMWLYGTIGTLANSGTIAAVVAAGNTDGTAYGIQNNAAISSFTNSGTIAATVSEQSNTKYAYGFNNNGSVSTFANTGVLSAVVASGNTTAVGYGYRNGSNGVLGALNNSGTIFGTDYGVYDRKTIGTLTNTGTISGARQSGIWVRDVGSLSVVVNAGTISGGLYGIESNSTSAMVLTNTGTISGGTAAVWFASGGNVLNIYDRAVFTGGVNFNSRGGNTLNFYTGSYTLPVQNYVLSANAINLLGAAQTLVTSGLDGAGTGNIVLVDTAAAGSLGTVTADVQRQVSGVIRDIMSLDVERPGSLLQPTTAPLGYASEKKDPAAAVINGADRPTVVDGAGNLFWLRSFAGGRWQDAAGSMAASNAHQYGVLAGVDHRHFGALRLGVFAGAGRTTTSLSSGSGNLDADMALAGLYARQDSGDLSVDAVLTTGRLWADASRGINGGTEVARGSFDGWFVAPEAAVSVKYALTREWTLTPSLRGRYVATYYNGYSEHGSSQNVSYDAHTTQSLEEAFDLRLSYKTRAIGLPSVFWAGAGASATERLGSAGYGASLSGGGFSVKNLGDATVWGGSLSTGFDVAVARNTNLFGSFEGMLYSDHSRSAIARGGIKVAF